MSLQPLGDMSVSHFLAHHWQSKPLVIRQAIPGFKGIVQIPELFELAARSDVESRVVARHGARWELRHGPIARRELARMPARNWTLLVQGVNLHLDAADRLLERFAFVPRARLDDVMVSYAAPGGGVGPHVDSYDVFLLQSEGRRRWRIGRARHAGLLPEAPISVLARFEPEQEWILEPGDMLYLPPGYAHDGVAVDACSTCSVGFRAPTTREIASALLARLEETLDARLPQRRYADRGARAAREPALVPGTMVDFARQAARLLRLADVDIETCLGEHLSEPKPQVSFDPPRPPLAARRFDRAVRTNGVYLDRRSIMLHRGGRCFINGDSFAMTRQEARPLRDLADARALPPGTAPAAELRKRLYGWYVHGWLHPGQAHGRGNRSGNP